MLRNEDLDVVEYRPLCRRGPQDVVMFSVWLGKHYQDDEIMSLEYQPFEEKPGLPHEAKLAAVLELRHEFAKCLDLDNIENQKKRDVYINMSTVNQGQVQVQVETAIIEIIRKLH